MADTSAISQFRFHSRALIDALDCVDKRITTNCAEESLLGLTQAVRLGVSGHLDGISQAANELGIQVPIEIKTIPYPDGAAPANPFLANRWEGRITIRFPGGAETGGTAAHVTGEELLVEYQQDAIVALRQWMTIAADLSNNVPKADATDNGNGDGAANAAKKRSTERGEGRAKLIAALTNHHQYADGSCLNLEFIGNNRLAEVAGVSPSTASKFVTVHRW
jgi:hypothetical protein